jgi:glucose dehydrogenase
LPPRAAYLPFLKWTLSVFARKVENGDAVWVYQLTPFDQWDYDGINENTLGEMEIRAVDRSSGKILWHRKLGSGIIGNPITYKVGGKQYVGVYSGIGGWIGLPVTAGLDLEDKFGAIGATAMTKAANLQHIPQGGELNVFRVME